MADIIETTPSKSIIESDDAFCPAFINNKSNLDSDQSVNCQQLMAPIILLGPSKFIKKDSDGTVPLQTNLHKLIQNKLKRKKRISSSLISINGDDQQHTINEEKRTKVEKSVQTLNQNQHIDGAAVITKPPLPPSIKSVNSTTTGGRNPPPPPRLKRKIEENSTIIQKLNAQTEQLRLEITDLKTALNCEKNAVRALR